MRSFSSGFAAHIKGEITTLCWAWKLIRTDGFILGFTDHDRDIVFAGQTYQAAQGFSPNDMENRLGYALDNSGVLGMLSSDALTREDIDAGRYDGARVEIFRVNWKNPAQSAIIWGGHIGDIQLRGEQFEAEIVGRAAALERSIGRVFSRLCDASFGDINCGINPASFPTGTSCPRTLLACRESFNNSANFRGFPYLVGEDASFASPKEGALKDGSSRYNR